MKIKNSKSILIELDVESDKYIFPTTISNAVIDADKGLCSLEEQLSETLDK